MCVCVCLRARACVCVTGEGNEVQGNKQPIKDYEFRISNTPWVTCEGNGACVVCVCVCAAQMAEYPPFSTTIKAIANAHARVRARARACAERCGDSRIFLPAPQTPAPPPPHTHTHTPRTHARTHAPHTHTPRTNAHTKPRQPVGRVGATGWVSSSTRAGCVRLAGSLAALVDQDPTDGKG